MQPCDLPELLIRLRSMPATTTDEAIAALRGLVGEHVRIRSGDNDSPTDDSTRPHHPPTSTRILLTAAKERADFSHKLIRQCNGVVLEYPSWKVLSIPSCIVNTNFSLGAAIKHAADYVLYDIKDGTTVTLYWYEPPTTTTLIDPGDTLEQALEAAVDELKQGPNRIPRWCMSSTNGFDIGRYRWMGKYTYMELVNLIVTSQYPTFNLNNLDKGRSYTIGFRHPEFHPLLTDGPNVWLIQSCDLTALNTTTPAIITSTDDNIGIPIQTPAIIPGLNTEGDPSNSAALQWIVDRNANAFAQYIETARSTTPSIHYGYILRSKGGHDADLMIESELLKHIRQLMYNLPKKHSRATRGKISSVITASNRLTFAALRAYLSETTRGHFISLFPQFSEQYRSFDATFKTLADKVVTYLRRRNIGPLQGESPMYAVDSLAMRFASHIRSNSDINVMNVDGYSIIMNFLIDKRYIDIYYTHLVSPNTCSERQNRNISHLQPTASVINHASHNTRYPLHAITRSPRGRQGRRPGRVPARPHGDRSPMHGPHE